MFKIHLSLKGFGMAQFEAIDFCRKHSLDDRIYVNAGSSILTRAVDEAFARTWFDNDTHGYAEVDVAWLANGELISESTGESAVALNALGVDTQRAKELYVRARFAKVEQVAIAQAEAPVDAVTGTDDET